MFVQTLNNGFEGPKASIIEPVTDDESELIRKVHNFAISEGCIKFLSFIESSPNASMYPSVKTLPGHIQFTSIPSFLTSAARDSVKLIKPALVMRYALLPAAPFLPPIEDMFTIYQY